MSTLEQIISQSMDVLVDSRRDRLARESWDTATRVGRTISIRLPQQWVVKPAVPSPADGLALPIEWRALATD